MDYVTNERFEVFLAEETAHHKQSDAIQAETAAQVHSMHKFLFGNGVPGWDEMLRELWVDLQKRKAEHERAEQAAAQDIIDAAKKRKEIMWEEIRKYIFFAITFIVSSGVGALIGSMLEK